MRHGQDVAICFAVLFLALAVWREIIWLMRFRTWKRAVGRVVGFSTEGDGPNGPTILYSVEGRTKTFESSFCLSNPLLGADVEVLCDPESDKAVMLTMRHRWFLTGLCGGLFVVMIGVAALSH